MSIDRETAGCIRVEPPLNEDERDYLDDLLHAGGTLRGTVTGRGDREVPFARSGWLVCADGCCLTWEPALEDATWMAATLRFLVDHLLRSGARGEGRGRFTGFTFDHVVSGMVLARTQDGRSVVLVRAEANLVTEQTCAPPCGTTTGAPPARSMPVPPNVVVFRPRRA